MALTIEQKPLYKTLAVGQDIIFTLSDQNVIINNYQPKYTADVYVNEKISDLGLITSKIASLKVTPNNAGVGIFSLNPILESYVNTQHEGTNFDNRIFSSYKTVGYTDTTPHPIHLIDKYSNNENVDILSSENNKLISNIKEKQLGKELWKIAIMLSLLFFAIEILIIKTIKI